MASWVVAVDDLSGDDIAALLHTHLRFALGNAPAGSGHALDIEALKAPDITFWSARDGAGLLGCIALRDLGGGHGEIKSMHTAEAHRGRGVACSLVEHLIGEARQRGYGRLSLETGKSEHFAPARDLYARLGFAPCPPFGSYVGDDFSYCMTLAL